MIYFLQNLWDCFKCYCFNIFFFVTPQVALGQDWFCFFDLANQQIMHTQNYSMMAYLSYSFVMTHFLFSTLQKSRISYPTTAAEKRNAQQKSTNIIETLLSEMTPTARAFNPVSTLVSYRQHDAINDKCHLVLC